MPPSNRIDVRSVAPSDRHSLIFSTFDALASGQAMELINDHDPRPLFQHFAARSPGEFDWSYLERGPTTWRVHITRLTKPAHGSGRCCGSCGGG